MDKISYALGLSLGNNLLSSGAADLNVAELTAGIQDVLDKKQPKISYKEAQELINKYFEELQAKAFEKNTGEILTEGNGATPQSSDTVKVHYHGTLIDGTVFDSSVQRGEPATFGVTQVISGWVEALQLMPVGSKWKLYIPSDLAYGAQGAGQQIGPHTALIFEVELLAIEN